MNPGNEVGYFIYPNFSCSEMVSKLSEGSPETPWHQWIMLCFHKRWNSSLARPQPRRSLFVMQRSFLLWHATGNPRSERCCGRVKRNRPRCPTHSHFPRMNNSGIFLERSKWAVVSVCPAFSPSTSVYVSHCQDPTSLLLFFPSFCVL